MQHIIFIIILSAGLLMINGCAGTTACGSQGQEAPQPLLLFQKTPCYGTCPAYNATFYDDGSVLYVGFRNVPVQDTLQLCLTKNQFQQIKASMQKLDYTSLESSYSSPYTDLPATYFTFYEGGREVKRIKHQQGGPQELLQLQEALHTTIMNLAKQKVEQK